MTESTSIGQLDFLRYPFEVVTQGGFTASVHQTFDGARKRQDVAEQVESRQIPRETTKGDRRMTDSYNPDPPIHPALKSFAEWLAAFVQPRPSADDTGDRVPLYQQCNQKDREVRT